MQMDILQFAVQNKNGSDVMEHYHQLVIIGHFCRAFISNALTRIFFKCINSLSSEVANLQNLTKKCKLLKLDEDWHIVTAHSLKGRGRNCCAPSSPTMRRPWIACFSSMGRLIFFLITASNQTQFSLLSLRLKIPSLLSGEKKAFV